MDRKVTRDLAQESTWPDAGRGGRPPRSRRGQGRRRVRDNAPGQRRVQGPGPHRGSWPLPAEQESSRTASNGAAGRFSSQCLFLLLGQSGAGVPSPPENARYPRPSDLRSPAGPDAGHRLRRSISATVQGPFVPGSPVQTGLPAKATPEVWPIDYLDQSYLKNSQCRERLL